MKKILLLLLFVTLSLACFSQSLYRTNSELNVRSSASGNSTLLGVLDKGSDIYVYSIQNGWAKTSYKNREAYVSSKYITLVKSAEQVAAEKQAAKPKPVKIPWYDPMGWGVIGWLLRWVALPFIVFGFGIMFPFMFIAEVREINNFFLGCISYIGGFFLLKLYIALFQIFDVYNGGWETAILWILGILLGGGGISNILNNRCPNCHYNGSNIIDSYITRRTRTTTTKYSDGSKDVSRSSTDTTNNHRQCPECGCDWWTRE